MKRIAAVSILLMAVLAACSEKDRKESYMSVISQDGNEILVSEHAHKWQCEAHSKNMLNQLQAPHNQEQNMAYSYECIPKSQFK